MSKKHLPAAVLVSIGCSVAFRDAPRAPRQPVDARDHENIALAEEVEDGPQFIAPRRRGATAFLRSDDLAPGRAEGGLLQFEVLVGRAHAGIADDGHVGSLSKRHEEWKDSRNVCGGARWRDWRDA
jgi:hypothetical protein